MQQFPSPSQWPLTRNEQVLQMILAIHCARLFPLPENPFDPSDWFASLSPREWDGVTPIYPRWQISTGSFTLDACDHREQYLHLSQHHHERRPR